YLASGSDDYTVRLWDAATGTPIGNPLKGHTDLINSVAFSSDGKYLVSGSLDCTVRLWDAAIGAPIGSPLKGHTNLINSVAFSSDGRQLVSRGVDNSVRVWDISHQVPQLSENPQLTSGIQIYQDLQGWLRGANEEHFLWIPAELRGIHLVEQPS